MNANDYVGMKVDVIAADIDNFHDFTGTVIGVRNGLFQVIDQEDNVYEVEELDMKLVLDIVE